MAPWQATQRAGALRARLQALDQEMAPGNTAPPAPAPGCRSWGCGRARARARGSDTGRQRPHLGQKGMKKWVRYKLRACPYDPLAFKTCACSSQSWMRGSSSENLCHLAPSPILAREPPD